jgi:hypothetical protein
MQEYLFVFMVSSQYNKKLQNFSVLFQVSNILIHKQRQRIGPLNMEMSSYYGVTHLGEVQHIAHAEHPDWTRCAPEVGFPRALRKHESHCTTPCCGFVLCYISCQG